VVREGQTQPDWCRVNRREFVSAAAKRSAPLALVTAAGVALGPAELEALESVVSLPETPEGDPLPLAPLGPPPLCTAPRGFGRLPKTTDMEVFKAAVDAQHAVNLPDDWGNLYAQVELARIWERMGETDRHPTTWGELADTIGEVWDRQGKRLDGRSSVEAERANLLHVGLDLDAEFPSDLNELARRCWDWRYGTGQFADGCAYRLPMSLRIWERLPEPIRGKMVALYEGADSPWGRTEEAAVMYLWHSGESGLRLQLMVWEG
jgi:hypothetical protein